MKPRTRRSRALARRILVVVAGLLPLLSGRAAVAQDAVVRGPEGRISGLVLDAEGGRPLAGATVTLEPLPQGIVVPPEGGGGGFLEGVRVTTSDADGRYAFDALAEASYRLRVALLGYRSATMRVDYRGPRESRVSVGLEIQPIQLAPVEVVLDPIIPMTTQPANGIVLGAERIQIEGVRQARYTQADARTLSAQDVVEAVTLGETDLFRALHRLPGVTAADDWSAELWTRGARWDETRIYYDGLPLYNPIHVGGVLTAVSPDAVGALMFHPGVRPAGLGDGSAAVVDMASRPAGGTLPVSAMAQVSLVSGRFTAQSPYARGSGVSLSGRRTWVDVATEASFQTTGDRTLFVPYQFTDLGGRWDQRLGDHLKLEASGLWSGDRIRGDIPDVLSGAEAKWGNWMARATVEGRWSSVRARWTVGSSRYDADLRQVEPDPDILAEFPDVQRGSPVSNHLRTDQMEVTLDRYRSGSALTAWRGGLRLRSTELGYDGPAPVPHPAGGDDGRWVREGRVAQATGWYEHRFIPLPALDVRAALQADVRDAGDRGGPSLWLSPRVTTAYALGPDARVTVGVGRHYQYEQSLAGVGFDAGPRLVPTHAWVQADGEVPVLRADVGTVGAEIWMGSGFLLSGTAYLRLSQGTLVPVPRPGFVTARAPVTDGGLDPAWRNASGVARGIDLSVRRIAGRITGSVSYSLGTADLEADGVVFPSPGDRRHAVDATLFARLARWVRLGAAYTGATGAPYTRFFPLSCPGDPECPSGAEGPDPHPVVGYAERPNGHRGPSYSSVDLLLELEGDVMGLKLGGFVQVRNIAARDNNGTYVGSRLSCPGAPGAGGCETAVRLEDRFEYGIPPFPLIGFWARF